MNVYEGVDGLDADLDGPVLRLTLTREKQRNALTGAMIAGLIAHIEAAGQDERVRVIALTTAGRDFCSGADLVAGNPDRNTRPRVGSLQRRLPSQAHRLIPLLLSVQTPVVVGVRGWAAGIGFHLAIASDFCVAAENARFWEPFVARGFTADSGGTWLLPRMVGPARARRLLLLGQELTGQDAEEWGLVHSCVPDLNLDANVEELVQQIAAGPTVALGLNKWLIQTGWAVDLERHLGNEAFALELSSRTSDFREGLAAFREKRNANFEGR